MNWNIIEGKWDQFAGRIRAQWGKLSDDDLELARGKRDVLFGKLKEKYGLERDQAEAHIDRLIRDL